MADKKWEKVEMNKMNDWSENDMLEGVYTDKEGNVGDNNSNVYTIRRENGEKVSFWGNTVLDVRIKNIEIGEEMKIVYKGKIASKKVKGRSYHDFDVFHRKTDFKKVEKEDIPVIEE